MTEWVKALGAKSDSLRSMHITGGREMTPANCLLISMCVYIKAHVCPYITGTYTREGFRIHINNKK